jgi:predicted N-acetyltransferase YhbS
MAWEPEAITVAAEDMDQATVVVCEDGGFLCGFYMLRGAPPEIEMSRLMVDPLTFGTGLGRRLWNHAVETAAQMGAEAMTLDADPNAEAFYLRMGAETVGEHDLEPPMMPGWRVKKMVFRIQPT